MLDLSKVWPEWKAVEKVGEGSFGKVFKCEREEYGISSVSAIKVISIPQSKAELESMSFEGVTEEGARTYFSEIVNDFANEIKLMEMLKGAPNVVAVENYKIVERADEIGWDIYIRMEYLQSFVAYSKNKKFTEAEVKKFALDISNALDICSKNGVIHRDVKPDNIFVDKFGSFKLGDFGVARRLEGSMSMMSKKGTYSYMAPEVFRGEKYDHRADIYSLGMVMYKLLNRNRDPFIDPEKPVVSFKERNESLERRRRGERLPAPIDASPEMASVILRACEFRPEDRYLTVDDFRNAILSVGARIINDEPTTKLFEDKTIVFAPRVFEFDETEPAVMTANPSALSSDETTAFADDEPTAFADDEATVMAGDEQTMIDEPTAFAQDVTCMADEPTVFAQDVTVFDDGKEPTVFADDEATVMAEPTLPHIENKVSVSYSVSQKEREHKRLGYAIASDDETVLPAAQRETKKEIKNEKSITTEIAQKLRKVDIGYFVCACLAIMTIPLCATEKYSFGAMPGILFTERIIGLLINIILIAITVKNIILRDIKKASGFLVTATLLYFFEEIRFFICLGEINFFAIILVLTMVFIYVLALALISISKVLTSQIPKEFKAKDMIKIFELKKVKVWNVLIVLVIVSCWVYRCWAYERFDCGWLIEPEIISHITILVSIGWLLSLCSKNKKVIVTANLVAFFYNVFFTIAIPHFFGMNFAYNIIFTVMIALLSSLQLCITFVTDFKAKKES